MTSLWDDEAPYLIVGFDFGTTYSGIAWALSTKPNEVEIISEWDTDTDNNIDSAKVPSRISYTQNGEVVAWGFDHDPDDTTFSFFKLLLCEETKRRSSPVDSQRAFITSMETDLRRMRKTPADVTADYLRSIWNHALSVLAGKLGDSLLENLQIKLVLTIPAIWDHQAQELTKSAAKAAGLLNHKKPVELELCSEPEAAARYVLNDDIGMQVGDSFVVGDAGGGTIDLISYEVERLSPLRLKMCSEATGDLFGAVFLDNVFEKKLSSMVTPEFYNNLSRDDKKKIMSDWEHGIKRNFKHDQRAGKEWPIYIPGYSEPLASPPPYTVEPPRSSRAGSMAGQFSSLGIHADGHTSASGKLRMKTTDLEEIFGEVCPRVVQLVQEQVNKLNKGASKNAKAIFLVGGFGANKYLKEEVQRAFPNIQVRQPRGAWSAICRGAVLKGASDETVVNHIAKYHYGIDFRTKFDHVSHSEEDKVWDMYSGDWYAHHQMQWYVSRGDDISKSQQVTHSWRQTVTSRNELATIKTTIYYCIPETAPSRRTSDVVTLCKLTSHLDPEVFDDLPELTNKDGVKYRKLNYTINMKVTSSGLDWQLFYEGVSKGRAVIAADYRVGPPSSDFRD